MIPAGILSAANPPLSYQIVAGTTTEAGSTCLANYLYCGMFQATKTANGVTTFRVYSSASGNAKIQIYNNNSGTPGTLVSANDTGQAVSSGWNNLSVPSCNIVSGTDYWLGIVTSASGAARRNTTGGVSRYKSATYSSFTAVDNPSGLGSQGTLLISLALWGYA